MLKKQIICSVNVLLCYFIHNISIFCIHVFYTHYVVGISRHLQYYVMATYDFYSWKDVYDNQLIFFL